MLPMRDSVMSEMILAMNFVPEEERRTMLLGRDHREELIASLGK